MDAVFEATQAVDHLKASFMLRSGAAAVMNPVNKRLEATLNLDSNVSDYARLQRVIMVGTQGDNKRGAAGEAARK